MLMSDIHHYIIEVQKEILLNDPTNINDQLNDIRMRKHNEFLISNQLYAKKIKTLFINDVKNTLLIASSMMMTLVKTRLSRHEFVEVRGFRGSIANNMYNYITPLLRNEPDFILTCRYTHDSKEKISETNM